MLENSRDILNWALGISVVMVAILFSWLLYQMGRTIKSVNDTVKGVQKIVSTVDETVENLKSKAGNMAGFLAVFIKGAQEVMKAVRLRKSKKQTKK